LRFVVDEVLFAELLVAGEIELVATRPVYPELALGDGREGTTVTRLAIGTGGRVASCEIVRSSGWTDLDAAACEGVRGWIYLPATDAEGLPVEASAVQPLQWQLEQFRE